LTPKLGISFNRELLLPIPGAYTQTVSYFINQVGEFMPETIWFYYLCLVGTHEVPAAEAVAILIDHKFHFYMVSDDTLGNKTIIFLTVLKPATDTSLHQYRHIPSAGTGFALSVIFQIAVFADE